MMLCWTSHAWDDYLYWKTNDKKTLKRINTLIKETIREPFAGIGQPEPLKHDLSGYWSRRIDQQHRLIYQIADGRLLIIQCRYHY